MAQQYTALGFWNDYDEITICGIVEGTTAAVFGGDDCTDGGPWASEQFEARDQLHAEELAEQLAADFQAARFGISDDTTGEG